MNAHVLGVGGFIFTTGHLLQPSDERKKFTSFLYPMIRNKHISMTDEEKKEFEDFLKWKAEKAKATDGAKKEESIKIDVNAKVNANIAPSVNIGWYKKLSVGQKNLLLIYVIWFVVHILFLVSGEGADHFFPRIYKASGMLDYAHLRQHGWAPVPPKQWTIEWDLDYYGFPEFIVYAVLIPIIIYFIYTLFKKNKKAMSERANNQ